MTARTEGRAYSFVSRWTLGAPRAECWAVLADPTLSWPTWWPRLTGDVIELGADTLLRGSRARLFYRAPLGYQLRIDLEATCVEPPSGVRLAVSGDLEGTGVVTLAEANAAGPVTVVTVHWDVRTTRRWMNAAGPVLARVFGWAHEKVMRDGERGLGAHLAATARVPGPLPSGRPPG